MASQIKRIKFIKNYPKQLIIEIIFLFIKGILILRYNLKGYFLIIVCFLFSLFKPSIKGCRPRTNVFFFNIDSLIWLKTHDAALPDNLASYRAGRMTDRRNISSYYILVHTLYVWLYFVMSAYIAIFPSIRVQFTEHRKCISSVD